MLIHDLTLLLDLFGNSEGTKLLIWTVIFCLVFTAPEKWRVELRAKTGHYRNRCLIRNKSLFLWYLFTFNVVITHEIITFQDICIDEIPKYFTSIKCTFYAALRNEEKRQFSFSLRNKMSRVTYLVKHEDIPRDPWHCISH